MAKLTWIETVAACKKSIGSQKKGYSQTSTIEVTVNGKTLVTRRDCSGFVSVCLSFFTGSKILTNSTSFVSSESVESYLKKAGFKKVKWTGWDKVKTGDILAIVGHVEISAKSGTKQVYNCGSNSSSNNPGITTSSRSEYTCIWRLDEKKTENKTTTKYTKADFIKDVETALGMKSPNTKANSNTLDKTITLSTKKNTKHKCVTYVQKYLKAQGYTISVSKVYDTQTANAVKKFQKKHNGVVDGVIDAKEFTWKKLLGLV